MVCRTDIKDWGCVIKIMIYGRVWGLCCVLSSVLSVILWQWGAYCKSLDSFVCSIHVRWKRKSERGDRQLENTKSNHCDMQRYCGAHPFASELFSTYIVLPCHPLPPRLAPHPATLFISLIDALTKVLKLPGLTPFGHVGLTVLPVMRWKITRCMLLHHM